MKSVLLVDDESAVRFGISRYLETQGVRTVEAACLGEAREAMSREDFGAILLDVRLPDGDGMDFLKEIRRSDPTVPVILITGHGTIAMAVEAMREGADHFLTKPVDLRELEVLLGKALQLGVLRREHRALRERPRVLTPFLGTCEAMARLTPLLEASFRHRSPVFIRGETGTGKGLLARLIHERSGQRTEPFVELNCAGLKGEFLESELFGHARGAFTGAVEAKEGLLERAHRGTLFLDEIGDMDVTVQSKFLKVLEEKRFRPLGRVEERISDFRLICATHQDVEKLIAEGRFRQDLYFRINTLTLTLPPLRERSGDLEALVQHLVGFIAGGRSIPRLDPKSLEMLRSYAWPGNLRELHNVLERAYILSDGRELMPSHFFGLGSSTQPPPADPGLPPPSLDLDGAEKAHIARVLRNCGGNVPEAAKTLGVSRATLYRKISQHGLRLEDHR
ncbi:MAG: sigma-54 dependent transcriptional regulator [Acidobacteriota bacterium]